jgi:hypothetical protein
MKTHSKNIHFNKLRPRFKKRIKKSAKIRAPATSNAKRKSSKTIKKLLMNRHKHDYNLPLRGVPAVEISKENSIKSRLI